jgi:hypothetical protein
LNGALTTVRARRESVIEFTFTFEALKRFEHFNQLDGAKDIRIFGGNLNRHLEIFAHVDAKHIVHARERLFGSQFAKVVHEPLEGNV